MFQNSENSLNKAKRFGALMIICAPSGAGKSTLIGRLTQEFSNIAYSVSCTTRQPRAGEKDGVDYWFCDEATFLKRQKEGFFAEYAFVHGHWYGTPLKPLQAMLEEGRDVIFDIDVQGATQLKKTMPNGRYVFILPPSMNELERRLRGRGTDSEEDICRRMHNAVGEIREASWFDACIVNDTVENAYALLRAFYLASTLAPCLHGQFLSALSEQASR